jgi:hypothetical protein
VQRTRVFTSQHSGAYVVSNTVQYIHKYPNAGTQ